MMPAPEAPNVKNIVDFALQESENKWRAHVHELEKFVLSNSVQQQQQFTEQLQAAKKDVLDFMELKLAHMLEVLTLSRENFVKSLEAKNDELAKSLAGIGPRVDKLWYGLIGVTVFLFVANQYVLPFLLRVSHP